MKFFLKILIASLICLISQYALADWLDADVQAFLDQHKAKGDPKPIEQLPPEEARKAMLDFQSAPVDLSAVDIKTKSITYNNKPISLTIVRPKASKKISPAFMFFHGGGWVLGDFQTHARLVRDLVVGSGLTAVFVNYTLSPETKFPEAINQAYAATRWVAENGKEINVDGKRLAVVGDSAGGNMATVVCLMAKDKGTPSIKYQVLLYPVTDANFDNTSYHKFANGFLLTKSAMIWFWDNYIPDPKQRQEIYASPLNATIEQLKGLPPALIQTAENDVLCDEGEAYAHKLNAAGIHVTSVRYNGMIHDFVFLNAFSHTPTSQAALQQVSEELKKHL